MQAIQELLFGEKWNLVVDRLGIFWTRVSIRNLYTSGAILIEASRLRLLLSFAETFRETFLAVSLNDLYGQYGTKSEDKFNLERISNNELEESLNKFISMQMSLTLGVELFHCSIYATEL